MPNPWETTVYPGSMSSDEIPTNDPRGGQRAGFLRQNLYGPEYIAIMKKYGLPDDQGASLGDFADTNTGAAMTDVLMKGQDPATVQQTLQAFDKFIQDFYVNYPQMNPGDK